MVSYGGQVGPGPWQNECPHVVEVEPGLFYYFRNQYYGQRARNWVYCSDNPLNFGIDDDAKLVRSWHRRCARDHPPRGSVLHCRADGQSQGYQNGAAQMGSPAGCR